MDEPPNDKAKVESSPGEGAHCPHCGSLLPAKITTYCPRCGKNLIADDGGFSRALLVFLFAVLGVPSLVMGGCLVVAGIGSIRQDGGDGGLAPPAIAVGLAGIGIFAGLLYVAFLRKK
jgi:hypothetical protein